MAAAVSVQSALLSKRYHTRSTVAQFNYATAPTVQPITPGQRQKWLTGVKELGCTHIRGVVLTGSNNKDSSGRLYEPGRVVEGTSVHFSLNPFGCLSSGDTPVLTPPLRLWSVDAPVDSTSIGWYDFQAASLTVHGEMKSDRLSFTVHPRPDQSNRYANGLLVEAWSEGRQTLYTYHAGTGVCKSEHHYDHAGELDAEYQFDARGRSTYECQDGAVVRTVWRHADSSRDYYIEYRGKYRMYYRDSKCIRTETDTSTPPLSWDAVFVQ